MMLTLMIAVFTHTHLSFPDDIAPVDKEQDQNTGRETPSLGNIIADPMAGLQLVEPRYFDF